MQCQRSSFFTRTSEDTVRRVAEKWFKSEQKMRSFWSSFLRQSIDSSHTLRPPSPPYNVAPGGRTSEDPDPIYIIVSKRETSLVRPFRGPLARQIASRNTSKTLSKCCQKQNVFGTHKARHDTAQRCRVLGPIVRFVLLFMVPTVPYYISK